LLKDISLTCVKGRGEIERIKITIRHTNKVDAKKCGR
jgi:hypothetical protein